MMLLWPWTPGNSQIQWLVEDVSPSQGQLLPTLSSSLSGLAYSQLAWFLDIASIPSVVGTGQVQAASGFWHGHW